MKNLPSDPVLFPVVATPAKRHQQVSSHGDMSLVPEADLLVPPTVRSPVSEVRNSHLSLFLRFYLFNFRERETEGEIEGEEHQWWLPLVRPLLGTWPTTQACALTGSQTGDPLVRRPMFSALSYPSQGRNSHLLSTRLPSRHHDSPCPIFCHLTLGQLCLVRITFFITFKTPHPRIF